jgi:hypothetical protein
VQSRPRATEGMLEHRTGRHTLALTMLPEDISLRDILRDMADRMTRMIETATDDGRDYEVQLRISAHIAVNASQAKVGDVVTHLSLEVPDSVNTLESNGAVYRRSVLGWERVE